MDVCDSATTFETRRRLYLDEAWRAVPRILASVDLNSFGPSYGCCDRQFWHYRTAAFPSEMYQEAALPLALAYRHDLPGNRWHGEMRLAEAATAALRFSMRSAHADGSADDYYPQERALGAVVFSLQAATEAYRLLSLDDELLLDFFQRRAWWVARHDESGRLTNHHALAALAVWRTGELLDCPRLKQAALQRAKQVIGWQSSEGWFPEYGGADPGYQTVTIDCLAKLRREAQLDFLDEPLARAVCFSRWFQSPDGSYGGVYGSRGTRHLYPHGMELLAAEVSDAAQLADGFLDSLAAGHAAQFDDDRMYVHRAGNLIEAYLDARPRMSENEFRTADRRVRERWFPKARLFVLQGPTDHFVAAPSRGGSFQAASMVSNAVGSLVDSGLVVELSDGTTGISQTHDLERPLHVRFNDEGRAAVIRVESMLQRIRFERATPVKQALLHFAAIALGGWGRGVLRRLLQGRVIHANRSLPIRSTRTLERGATGDASQFTWRVVDQIELLNRETKVRSMAFASEFQAAYTAATSVYQTSLLQPWRNLDELVAVLNSERRVEIVRQIGASDRASLNCSLSPRVTPCAAR